MQVHHLWGLVIDETKGEAMLTKQRLANTVLPVGCRLFRFSALACKKIAVFAEDATVRLPKQGLNWYTTHCQLSS